MSTKMATEFAPAERASLEDIISDNTMFIESEKFKAFDYIPDILLILNKERQVVFANKPLFKALGVNDFRDICGLRTGELLHCQHACETTGGCGTSNFCRECGAVNAIQCAINGQEVERECQLIIQETGEALDLRIMASPIEANGRRYIILAIKDIADEKRRQALERIFFHDILNTAGAIKSTADYIHDSSIVKSEEEIKEMVDIIHSTSDILVDEINAQRQLLAAENKKLKLSASEVCSLDLLMRVRKIYEKNCILSENVRILVNPAAASCIFKTDLALILRILSNMVKNALEASQSGDSVILNCISGENAITFTVQNPAFIPEHVQNQIFNRSFSTKGSGRGLGTYSIKLLGEKYLKGTVSFDSSEETGTIFMIQLPINGI